MGESLTQFVQRVYSLVEFDGALNAFMIALIPKLDSPKNMTQFRPIALCNILVKIITKVVANR